MARKETGIKIVGKIETVDEIFKSWCLNDHGIDEEVISDIKSAIYEAYMSGCLHGGLDNDIHDEAIDFFRK